MIKKLVTITTFVLLLTNMAVAAPAPFDPSDFSFVIHLFYDNGRLVFNRDAKLNYEVVGLSYVPEQISRTSSPSAIYYRGEVVSVSGSVLNEFNFDPTKGNPNFKRGVVDVSAPYYTDAKTINLYNDKDQIILAVDTADTLVCNGNNLCEADKGEDSFTCASDCPTPTPVRLETPSPSVAPVVTDSTDWLTIVIIVLLVIAIAGAAAWFIIKRRREKAKDISITLPPPTE